LDCPGGVIWYVILRLFFIGSLSPCVNVKVIVGVISLIFDTGVDVELVVAMRFDLMFG
jgi:hypothetical protein